MKPHKFYLAAVVVFFKKANLHFINSNTVQKKASSILITQQSAAGERMGKVQREMKHYLNEAAFNELLISRKKPMIDFRKHHLIRQVRSKVEVQR